MTMVIVKNGYFAAGRNSLEQQRVTIEGIASFDPTSYINPAELPTVRNQRPNLQPHGTMAIVTPPEFSPAAEAVGAFVYQGTVDDIFVDRWVPLDFHLRGVEVVRLGGKGGPGPAVFFDEDSDPAQLPGWMLTGSVTADASRIRIAATGVGDVAEMRIEGFDVDPPASPPFPKPMYLLISSVEVGAPTDGADIEAGALVQVGDGIVSTQATWWRGGQANSVGFWETTGRGDGRALAPFNTRVDISMELGVPGFESPSGLATARTFNRGYSAGESDAAATRGDLEPLGGIPFVSIRTESGTAGNTSEVFVSSLILLKTRV